jgi:hypothetical protein
MRLPSVDMKTKCMFDLETDQDGNQHAKPLNRSAYEITNDGRMRYVNAIEIGC